MGSDAKEPSRLGSRRQSVARDSGPPRLLHRLGPDASSRTGIPYGVRRSDSGRPGSGGDVGDEAGTPSAATAAGQDPRRTAEARYGRAQGRTLMGLVLWSAL